MNTRLKILIVCISTIVCTTGSAQSLQRFEPVNFSKVIITDSFWKPKMDKVATATLAACIYQTEVKTPRIRNFEKVARNKGEKHEGIYYDDSDVYKALEAIAYSLKNHPDAALEKKADEWIDKIVSAQLPDGYLNTYYTLTGLDKRWTDMEKHEDYCAGHLMEAAVAYYNTTGKRKLLDAAIRFADHIDSIFRRQNRPWVSGHQEIELALMKLYHVTKNNRYLQLADWFLDQRGRGHGKGVIWDQWKDPKYCQDDVPVKSQKEITGHAVRAMYLYTGAADVAAVTGDSGYMRAMKTVWEDVVFRNMYVTGGIGSSGSNEGFTIDYDLPNENAYCETCASVGMVFWNHRMNVLTGESKYMDVLEKSLYNGALAGLSISGDRFFYGNPLASSGQHYRREWFGTACCPSNIARLVSSVGNYIYGQSEDAIWINLFIGSKTSFNYGRIDIEVSMQTGYPFTSGVKLTIDPSKNIKKSLRIRLPGWLTEPVPGGLYRFYSTERPEAWIRVNGKLVPMVVKDGYASIEKNWQKGDVVELDFAMQVEQLRGRPEIKQTTDRVAIQRGPLIYCMEGVDNNGNAWNMVLPQYSRFTVIKHQVLSEKLFALQTEAPVIVPSQDGRSIAVLEKTITLIPYYAWANRGQTEMQVWLPMNITGIKLNY
ncbi:MAG TPA: beta-L-arabinofuranosidase domain-containing protein [Chitinophagaceae bacterium]|nr:beta-L-arabinofuranosidase domain-containing protein [Chitinophagaceae bacterium]